MAMVECSCYKGQISDKAKKCVHCGTILIPEERKICIECGAELETGVEICPKCGCPAEAGYGAKMPETSQHIRNV